MDIDTRVNKKLRSGDEVIQFSDKRHVKITSPFSEYDDYDDSGIEDKKLKQYIKFMKEYNVNLGFDIETFVPHRLGDTVRVMRVDIFDESDLVYRDCVKAVRSVLKHLDEQEEQRLELVDIIRANYRANYTFFVTFRARDKKTDAIQTYQSMVYRHFLHLDTTLYIFKKEGEPIAKVEVVEPEFSDEREEYEFEKITGRFISSCGSQEYVEKSKKYIQEHNESEGFDIQHFVISPASLTPVSRADRYTFNHCTEAVMLVLDHLKEKGELNLELLRLIKANYRWANLYYVTFEAKNENSGVIEVYQSVIYHERYDRETVLYRFRKREERKGKVVPAVEDLRNEYEFGKANKIDIANFKKLCEHDDIKDFHIFTEPERGVTGTELFQDCEIALKDVLEYLSLKGERQLKLVKITTAKYEEQQDELDDDDDEISYTFCINFEVKNKDSELETYESVISLDVDAQTRLHMLRKEK